MNKLKAYREALNLHQQQVAKQLQTVEPRVDVGMVSRYENGVCLPPRNQLKKLEEIYHANRFELYPVHDLDLFSTDDMPIVIKSKKPPEKRKPSNRKCFRMTPVQFEWFTKDKLQAMGYADYQTWFDACFARFKGEYDNKTYMEESAK